MVFWNPGQLAGGFFTPPNVPILDQVTSATAAYSTRLLKSTYAGSAIRVRRSSDNAEADIGFLSGELDQAALLAHVGAGSGYIVTWYDQSGNGRDMAQATAANQPRIVNAGTLNTLTNGKPAVQFIGGSSTYVSSAFGLAQPITECLVAKRDANVGASAEVLSGGGSFTCSVGTKATTGYFDGYSGVDLVSSTVVPQITFSAGYVYNGASSAIYYNGTSIATGDIGANGITSPFELGSWAGGTQGGPYSAAEFILYNSVLSTADRQLIETSQSFFLT